MQIRRNPDGTVTVRIARGPEGYDGSDTFSSSGGLYSEETLSEDAYKAALKNEVTVADTAPAVDPLSVLAAQSPGLRDLIHLGDSELPHASPVAFPQLAKQAAKVVEQGQESAKISPKRATSAKAKKQVVATGGTEANLTAPAGAPTTGGGAFVETNPK